MCLAEKHVSSDGGNEGESLPLSVQRSLVLQTAEKMAMLAKQMRGRFVSLLSAGYVSEANADLMPLCEAADDSEAFLTLWYETMPKSVRGQVERKVNELLRKMKGGSILDASKIGRPSSSFLDGNGKQRTLSRT